MRCLLARRLQIKAGRRSNCCIRKRQRLSFSRYTRLSQPIQSTCETAMTNRNCTRLDLWACDSVPDVTADIAEGSGRSTYLSDRS